MTKERFEQELIKVIRRLMADYDKPSNSELMGFAASIQLTHKGNFTDPESGDKYGYSFTISDPNFWEDSENER